MRAFAGWAALVLAILVVAIIWFDPLADFEVPAGPDVVDIRIPHEGEVLAGTLVLPAEVVAPVLVLVHGDGPQDRWSSGGYLPLIHALRDRRIGVFTWDKPGVGESGGDWLDQSMEDRAAEAAAVMRHLREERGIAAHRLGFLGFSQAGWVVPKAVEPAGAGFAVLVGPAVDWRRQGAYYTVRRLGREGWPPDRIEAELARIRARDDAAFLDAGVRPPDMDPARYGFVARNFRANATMDLAEMRVPLFALWGAEDLNVDPSANLEAYRETAPEGPHRVLSVIPDATHGLLRAGPYNYQLVEEWSMLARARFLIAGRRAFAQGVIDQIADWVHARARAGQ